MPQYYVPTQVYDYSEQETSQQYSNTKAEC